MSKAEIVQQYDLIGPDYLKGQREFFSNYEDQAIKFMVQSMGGISGKSILDMGCGSGFDIKRYEEMGAGIVYGIDTSEYMVSEARKVVKAPDKVIRADMQQTGFKDGLFDVVASRFALHYLENFELAYSEISRILKDGGHFVFVASHPLQDFLNQKEKTYGKQEIIEVKLYNNSVPIRYPSHTLKDYFSDGFFKHFKLTGYGEEQSPEVHSSDFRTPGFIGVRAIKKNR